MPFSPHEQALLSDNQKAHDEAYKFKAAVDAELYARGLEFSVALQKFATFLGLKDTSSSNLGSFVSLAATALTLAQPELFLIKFLGERKEAITLALTIANAAGSKTAKVIQGVEKIREGIGHVQEVGGKVKGVYDKAKDVKENVEKIAEGSSGSSGSSDLTKLDAGDAIKRLLVEQSRFAFRIWESALGALNKHFELRLADPAKPQPETLESLAKRLLPPPRNLSEEELKEVQLVYLYEMIRAYAKTRTVSLDWNDWTSDGGRKVLFRVKMDINDNQRDTIKDKFGPNAKRGRIYTYPPVYDVGNALIEWGAKKKEHVAERHWTGRMQ